MKCTVSGRHASAPRVHRPYDGAVSLQVTRVGVATSASCLLSLITYPYLDTAGQRDTICGLTALAQACSHLPSMSFTGSLLAACGECLLSSMKTSGPCSPVYMLYSSSVHRILLGCYFNSVQGLHLAAHTSLVQM